MEEVVADDLFEFFGFVELVEDGDPDELEDVEDVYVYKIKRCSKLQQIRHQRRYFFRWQL